MTTIQAGAEPRTALPGGRGVRRSELTITELIGKRRTGNVVRLERRVCPGWGRGTQQIPLIAATHGLCGCNTHSKDCISLEGISAPTATSARKDRECPLPRPAMYRVGNRPQPLAPPAIAPAIRHSDKLACGAGLLKLRVDWADHRPAGSASCRVPVRRTPRHIGQASATTGAHRDSAGQSDVAGSSPPRWRAR
jgi:hypothetical protein